MLLVRGVDLNRFNWIVELEDVPWSKFFTHDCYFRVCRSQIGLRANIDKYDPANNTLGKFFDALLEID